MGLPQKQTSNKMWARRDHPRRKLKAIGSKWVFKVKYNSDGSIERFKARLVVQGFSQVPGIDFIETFASTVRRESLRIFMAIATILGFLVHQIDIVGAYLESLLGDNEEPIYMKPPPGINQIRTGLYCRLLKSLYGLQQSGRLWNKNIIEFFTKFLGLTQLNSHVSILIWRSADGEISMVSIYVDDFLIEPPEQSASLPSNPH